MLAVFKALSNETRLKILQWLKEPEQNFSLSTPTDEKGVTVSLIQQKAGLSQSTTSHYLSLLQDAKLISATRCGQWTYYRRNEEVIDKLIGFLQRRL
ncbi:MAG: metalloregulator ArsR/SmtB family transcription factor [Coxiellaceae bacterium]|nr:metalloregulator ArsR/SmtB family transcription factor [Coxiellaceae bacterium]MDF1795234.1 metalloregulator ArsR/SmtB family transcription factor [Coxiellaceae bacterium]